MNAIPGVHILGSSDPDHVEKRLGVIAFNVGELSHVLVASILGYEHGIGVRNGRFCAYPYLVRLLDLSEDQVRAYQEAIRRGDRSNIPGAVRVSLGIYNTRAEVDAFLSGLQAVAEGAIAGDYVLDPATGDYAPRGWEVNFANYFSWD